MSGHQRGHRRVWATVKRVPGPVWAVGAVLLAGSLGWWAGSATACVRGGGCAPNVAAIEALGTWVGGLATAGGLIFAGLELRENRADAQRQRDAELTDLRVFARQVKLSVEPRTAAGGWLTQVKVVVTNTSQKFVRDIHLFVDGKPVGEVKEQVHPGVDWTWLVSPDEFGEELAVHPGTKVSEDPDSIAAVRAKFLPKLRIRYSIGTAQFWRDKAEVGFLDD